jgi:hypothetical protein
LFNCFHPFGPLRFNHNPDLPLPAFHAGVIKRHVILIRAAAFIAAKKRHALKLARIAARVNLFMLVPANMPPIFFATL